MSIYLCQKCGHIEFNNVPENCPACGAPKSAFKQKDNIFEESREKSPEAEGKHVPSIKVNKTCDLIPEQGCVDVNVRIGETLHPSVSNHFIQFVDCYQDEKFIGRTYFTPDVFPATSFHVKEDAGKVTIVENCNIHGYWMSEVNL